MFQVMSNIVSQILFEISSLALAAVLLSSIFAFCVCYIKYFVKFKSKFIKLLKYFPYVSGLFLVYNMQSINFILIIFIVSLYFTNSFIKTYDNLPKRLIEYVKMQGANNIQVFKFAIFPELLPKYIVNFNKSFLVILNIDLVIKFTESYSANSLIKIEELSIIYPVLMVSSSVILSFIAKKVSRS